MTSNHDESGDDTTSSLEDSSYDIIQDRSNVTTDDEDQDAMTESTTSSDGHAFEQVQAPLPDSEQGDYIEQPSQNQRADYTQQQKGSSDADYVLSTQVSSHAIAHRDFQFEHQPIEFDEPSITNLNSSRFTEVSHTLKIIEKENPLNESYSNLLDRIQGHLAVTVRQTMTSHSLAPEYGQYKIMYVGDVITREPIVQKIGTALAAGLKTSKSNPETPRVSKFNIVPISAFGEESSPEVVLIDSSGLELIVEDCSSAEFARDECGNDTLRLDMSGSTIVDSHWNGSKFTVTDGWRLPDLAIFCLPDNDDFSSRKTRQFARSFMSRHKVLSVVISQSSTWHLPPSEPTTLDYLTPHICLESRKSSPVHAQIMRRYPIDLTTFLNIDAGQLNRNLACLAVASHSPRSRQDHNVPTSKVKNVPNGNDWSGRELVGSLITDVRKDGIRALNRYEYIAGFAVLLISLLGIVIGGLGLSELLGASRVSTSRVFPTQTSPPFDARFFDHGKSRSTASSSLPSVFTSTANSLLTPPAHATSTKSVSPNTDLASFLLDAYTLAPNKSEQFKVHVLGDCHIVLRPPHWFGRMRRSPKLLFKILRGDSELEHQTTTLFDGVYALQVPGEDAYGILSVEIWTESKPIVNENFDVDFGSPWLKVSGWKKTTRVLTKSLRGDLHYVQRSLSTVYDHTKAGLSNFLQQQRKKILIKKPIKAAAETRELIVAKTRDFQRTFSRGLYAARATTSRCISQKVEGVTNDLALYTHNTTSRVSHQAEILVRTVSGPNMAAFVTDVRNFGRRHLRETQKRTLKAWWSLRGAPKQRGLETRARDNDIITCEF